MLLVVAAGTESRRLGGSGRTPVRWPVELGREEASPAHLAVGHDVDAGLLLVPDARGRPRRRAARDVRLRRTRPRSAAAIGRREKPARVGRSEPADARSAAMRRSVHSLASDGSVKANARAGLRRTIRRRTGADAGLRSISIG